MEIISEKLCIDSHMFKLQLPSKYSALDAIHRSRCFFHCSKQFLNSSILMPFSASVVFCFTSPTLTKRFSLRTFFHPGKQKKCHSGRDHVTREGGAWGHAGFGQKLQNTQCGVGRCAHKSPIVKWVNALKESSKKSLKRNVDSHPTTGWYTATDGFLELSPSGGNLYYLGPTLQKIILGFFGVPLLS